MICNFAVARDVESAAKAEIRALRGREHIRLQKRELQIIAAVQGEFHNLFLIDHIPQCGVFAGDQRRRGTDLHFLRQGAHLQRNIEACLLVGLQHDAGSNHPVEAGILGRQAVIAGSELRNRVFPIVAHDHGTDFIGAGVRNCDFGAGHDCARIIRHAAHDRGAKSLRC